MENIDQLYDVLIVGAGPAGLSAAIYMARAKYKVLVIEKEKIGGQITITSDVVNYPGIERTSGTRLTEAMKIQAEAFGAQFTIGEVTDMKLNDDIKSLYTANGEYRALGVIIAVGANPRKLGFPGEREFQGRGVAYCATCDGEFFTGKEVFVIGGGFAAVEEGIFLTKYAKEVTMIVREEDFTCARTVAEQVNNYDKIQVRFHTEVKEVSGASVLNRAVFKDNISGEEWEYSLEEGFGMFIFAGYVPNTALVKGKLELSEQGYIETDVNQKTSVEGVYAAGDVCIKNLRQVVTAVSDGAVAATSLEKHVSAIHDKLNIPELQAEATSFDRLNPSPAEEQKDSSGVQEGFIPVEVKQKLAGVFGKFGNIVTVRAYLDNTELSEEIKSFLAELEEITDMVKIEINDSQTSDDKRYIPSIELIRNDGSDSGIRFHGVPGGHEFNSFILALYNVAGPGQVVSEEVKKKIESIKDSLNIKIMVSLSCTMCPEVVMAAQKIAAMNDKVEAEMFDLSHYPQFKEKYNIMSVPCAIINDRQIVFGKKTIEEMVEIISGEL